VGEIPQETLKKLFKFDLKKSHPIQDSLLWYPSTHIQRHLHLLFDFLNKLLGLQQTVYINQQKVGMWRLIDSGWFFCEGLFWSSEEAQVI
jgi:hypothetical protein